MKTTPPLPLYRLRGTRDHDELTFDLDAGEHVLGSSRQADLVVPVTGVSRRHARLWVTPEALDVEDLGSTNGTHLGDTRVERGRIERERAFAGAEIRFGPACFRVRGVPCDDAELALVFEPSADAAPEPDPARFDPEETTRALGPRGSAQADLWLDWIDGFVAALGADPRGGMADALGFLGASVGAEGCCVARWSEDEPPAVIASWGEISELPTWNELRGRGAAPDPTRDTVLHDGEPPLALALSGEAATPVGLMIQGEFLGRAHSGRLRILARILALAGTRGSPASTRSSSSLRFPAGYRPGTSAPMKTLYAQMESLLHGDMPVLLHGETGAGKELVAHILHDSSERRNRPFVAVNCAAIPADLLEAEMFGIDKGVATGVDARPGKFHQAEGGTLFLDEIGEMAPALQAKLLRALQEKEIHPVGGRPAKIDVRVISATNVDLGACLKSGRLRSDLYYRLAGFLLEVPPLRDCREDLPGLIESFVGRFSAEKGIRVRGMTVAALRTLHAYSWPGNVRELEQEIRRLVYLSAHGSVLDSEKLSQRVRGISGAGSEPPGDPTLEERLAEIVCELESVEATANLELFEACLVKEALRRSGGNKSAASRLMGVSRNGLDKKLKRLGL